MGALLSRLAVLLCFLLSGACATTAATNSSSASEQKRLQPEGNQPEKPRPKTRNKRPKQRLACETRVARTAALYLQRRPQLHRNDCSGLVESILSDAGVAQRGGTKQLWTQAKNEGRVYAQKPPRPGHLVFFSYTYDANRNGRVDDRLTHVAVVVEVLDDGTLLLVHRGHRGIAPLMLNPQKPDQRRQQGQVINDYLRSPRYGPRHGKRLAGQLIHGYARPPCESELLTVSS